MEGSAGAPAVWRGVNSVVLMCCEHVVSMPPTLPASDIAQCHTFDDSSSSPSSSSSSASTCYGHRASASITGILAFSSIARAPSNGS